MRMFKIGRKCYEESKSVWDEYINLDYIATIEGSIRKDKYGGDIRRGYNVFMIGGNKIWINDLEMERLKKFLNINLEED